MNSAGDCEFYLEPVSTSEGSENNYGEDFEGCWIKGISCGGHTAIDCAYCPTPNSEHPEMECNGQCIYDYTINADHVLGVCRDLESKKKEELVDCGSHLAESCTACVTRFTYHCEGGVKYCNGDCSWGNGDCGTCPETNEVLPVANAYALKITTTTPAAAPVTTTTVAPITTTTAAPKKYLEGSV